MQFGLFMQNNSLVLFNQLYPQGPNPAGLPSKCETSPKVLLQLMNNTVPAGTRIVLTLSTDQNDFITGVLGQAYDISGSSIGNPVNWSAIGRDTWHDGPVKESALAPLAARGRNGLFRGSEKDVVGPLGEAKGRFEAFLRPFRG